MSVVSDRIEVLALRGFFALARALPIGGAIWLGNRIGDLLFSVVRIRRTVTLQNLAAAFPERTDEKRRRIARDCYRSFGVAASLFAHLPKLSGKELQQRVEWAEPAHLEAVAAMGRGAILLGGHFGHWEWVGASLPARGYPTRLVVGRQRNRLVEALMDDLRRSSGVGILSAESDLRGILEALRRGEFVGIVADQDAGRDGIFIDFLGRPASTAVGPVRLARRFGVPILMGFGIPLPGGRLRFETVPPILVPEDGVEEEVIERFTRVWSEHLERYVRTYPHLWFWMHRRWKTRPETNSGGEEE